MRRLAFALLALSITAAPVRADGDFPTWCFNTVVGQPCFHVTAFDYVAAIVGVNFPGPTVLPRYYTSLTLAGYWSSTDPGLWNDQFVWNFDVDPAVPPNETVRSIDGAAYLGEIGAATLESWTIENYYPTPLTVNDITAFRAFSPFVLANGCSPQLGDCSGPVSVPEPSSALLLATGLLGFAVVRRRASWERLAR